MAINMSEFTEKIEPGLKANKQCTRFFYRFKEEDTTKRGIIDYSNKEWDKKTRKNKAKTEFLKVKKKGLNSSIEFKDTDTLNKVAEIYFNNARSQTAWTKSLRNAYNLYCKETIGKKRIKDIIKVHIDKLIRNMEQKGQVKQTQHGCSPRTIKMVVIQTIKPIFEYILENKVLEDIPIIKYTAPKPKKKRVEKGIEKLAKLYQVIILRYQNNPFYRALFLFALYGRRWNEIRTLEWSDVDFLNNTYTIKAENSKIKESQTYDLPNPIFRALNEIKDDKKGLIFKSPVTGNKLHTPKVQLKHIREDSDIPELTMHYFRHILVSAMSSTGMADGLLSASLGHTELTTVNDYYKSADYKKGSLIANQTIEGITNT